MNDLKIQVELGPLERINILDDEPDDEKVNEYDLRRLKKSHFRRFYVERIQMIFKRDLIKIDEIHLNFFQYCLSGCKFNRNIIRIKDCHIKSIGTRVLERPDYTMYAETPWIELSQIKSLEQLIIRPWTDFSLYRLQSFPFYAITIRGRKKEFVSNIVEIKELLASLSIGPYITSPLWIYNCRMDMVIHLNNFKSVV